MRKPSGSVLSAADLANRKGLDLEAKSLDDARAKLARLAVDPEATTARVLLDFTPGHGLDLDKVAKELRLISEAVGRGDLEHVERLLLAQAVALNAVFVNLAERAQGQGPYLDSMQTLLGLALRAQNQSRATLETLANVKFPKAATFIRQANIASQQQVNNGALSHARASDAVPASELLEVKPDEALRLDPGTTGTAGRDDPPLEAVGALHGAENG